MWVILEAEKVKSDGEWLKSYSHLSRKTPKLSGLPSKSSDGQISDLWELDMGAEDTVMSFFKNIVYLGTSSSGSFT